ncbi:HPr kinase/phosphorylase [Flaviflagellibacter deserti]|uniref:HPr kinase/phosphorylase n=1 Tax=Flaviflagellibacter deserti TaxID=2267266 RepID=A0ABV9Z1K3_9HYPH
MSSIHASCVVLDGKGVLIRGASGAGKSQLAHMIILRAPLYGREAILVADDRVLLERYGGEVRASAPDNLKGLLEIRGLGIAHMPNLQDVCLGVVIDLVPPSELPRLPEPILLTTEIAGVTMPRAFAATPERGLDILLTMFGQAGAVIDCHEPLAPLHQDGKSKQP